MQRVNPEKIEFPGPAHDSDKKQKSRDAKCARCREIVLVLLVLAAGVCIAILAVTLKQCSVKVIPKKSITASDNNAAPKSASGSYRFGAVAADNSVCSRVGTTIMARQQGSTVDAAIATLLCIGIKNMHSAGLGGGFFMSIYDSQNKEIAILDSREVAPQAATEEMFVNDTNLLYIGGLAIAVPGELAGYAAAHARYGKLPWASLFEPAIKLAEDGFVIPNDLGKAIRLKEKVIREQPELRELLVKKDGTLYMAGDVIKMPLFGRTLRRIAEEGPQTFYNGSLADDVVKDIQDYGGFITKEDLSAYRPLWKKPVRMHLSNGNYTLNGPPPPSSSVIMNYILRLMDGYNVTVTDRTDLRSRILLTHRLVEAMKFGYGKRSYLGDENFVNITELVELLQNTSYISQTRMKIKDDAVLRVEDYDSSFAPLRDGGTSHLSVYGPDGSAVSVTSTINMYFGSKVLGKRTGILFNNEMDDFSTPGTSNIYRYRPSPSNYIAPGKRPMSSMSPTIVLNGQGQPVMIVGASGGSRIISATLQVIMNNLWLGFNVSEALDQPRIHHQLIPDELLYEISWPLSIRNGLAKKGHKYKKVDKLAVVQIINSHCQVGIDPEGNEPCLRAASDVRKKGAPDGF